MEELVTSLCRSSYFHLRKIASIRPYLSDASTAQLVSFPILSRLDCCSSALTGLPTSSQIQLQTVQNNAARLVFGKRKSDHVNHTRTYARTHTHTLSHSHTHHTHTHTHTRTHARTHARTHTHTCARGHSERERERERERRTRARTHTHTHTHTHTSERERERERRCAPALGISHELH